MSALIRSRQDQPFIAIGAKWKCSNVCSSGILTDREIWTLFVYGLKKNNQIHLWSLFNVQLFDDVNLPCSFLEQGIRGLLILFSCFFPCLFPFMGWYSGVSGVEEPHQSIPNLVVKLYCGDDTVGEARWENSSTPGWKKLNVSLGRKNHRIFLTLSFHQGRGMKKIYLLTDQMEAGPVAQRIRARGYEPRCRGFESLLAHTQSASKFIYCRF